MQKREERVIQYAFLLLLLCQLGWIIYFNLSDIRCSLDHDAANTIYHFMEVIKHRTLKLPDWNNTTTLELDSAFMLAVPLYFLTHNIYLSIGIANIIFAGLYIVVISRIMAYAGVRKAFVYFTLCLVITPHAFGMLDYFNMLFFGGSCYTVRVLVPLLFLLLVQILSANGSSGGRAKAELTAAAALYTVLAFTTAFSSGMTIFFCGIVPLVLCMAIDIWTDGENTHKYNLAHVGLIVGSLLIFLGGNVFHGHYWSGSSKMDNLLTKMENYAINFRACIAGIFQVFGALTSQDVPAFSGWGIIYCLKIGFVFLLLAVFFCNIVLLFKKTKKLSIKKYIAFLFLFTFVLFLVVECRYPGNMHMEYRYFLIGAVPLVVLLGMQMETWAENWKVFQQRAAFACLFAVLAVLMAGNTKNVYDNWDRSTYAVELCDYFNNMDVESIFFMNDEASAKICKGIDMNHKYAAFDTGTQTLVYSICSYEQATSGSFYGNKNILAVIVGNKLEDMLPEEIASQYEKIDTVRWYDLYYSDHVYFP